MSWVAWLFLLAGLYVLVVAVRGIVHLVSWLVEEYVIEPRSQGHPKEEPPQRPHAGKPATTLEKPETEQEHVDKGSHKGPRVPVKSVSRVRRPSRWSAWLKSLKTAAVRRGYDYWVACALAEEDLQMKIRYLSKALHLNPAYHPAWGMKGNALFELEKYDEAIECFDKSLDLHPSALVWYRKGLCCYHGGRRQEALRCLDKAREECPGQDRPFLEDVTRMRRLVEEELRCAEAP